MRCPSCDAEIKDPEAAFCSRCGRPLGAPEGEATDRLGADTAERRADDDPGSGESAGTADTQVSTGVWGPKRDEPAAPTHREHAAAPHPGPEEGAAATQTGIEERPAATQSGTDERGDAPTTGDGDRAGRPAPAGPAALLPVRDLAVALRRGFAAGGWQDFVAAACLSFLGLLAIASALLLAGKLQNPDLGAGANPLSILTAIVILALGMLGVSLSIGDVTLSALPLGAVLGAGWILAWSARAVVGGRDVASGTQSALEGCKLGACFGAVCWLAALVFRFRGSPPVAAAAGQALLLGGLWGAFFGAIGGLRTHAPLRTQLREAVEGARALSAARKEGILAGAIMLLATALLAGFAALVWVIVGLAKGAMPEGFGFGGAVAALVYLAAFLPNVLTSLAALSLGAPIEVGARATFAGRVIGPLRDYSLFDWGGGDAPWYLFLLLLIPVLACLLGGFAARRNAPEPGRAVDVLGTAALAYAFALAVLAFLSQARLGAGLVRSRGFAHVAPDALLTFVAAALWAGALGFVGWKLSESQESSTPDKKIDGGS